MGEKFYEMGPNFLNYVQHIFKRDERNFKGVPPSYGPAWSIGEVFSYCFLFVVSGENRLTKQMLRFVWILFLEKVIVFENLRKALETSSPAWLPMARSIPVQSQIFCDQTENRQLAI